VSDLGSATKEYNKLYVEDAAPDGVLTVTGTTTVSDVVKPSTNQLIDLGGPTNQWRSFTLRTLRYPMASQWMVDHVLTVYTRVATTCR
jgi:hypothetical protein